MSNNAVLSVSSVLFIVPPHGSLRSFKPEELGQKNLFLAVPYGVLSMASYIAAHSSKAINIEIFDCNKVILDNIEKPDLESVFFEELKHKILAMKPDCVGVSALFDTVLPHMVLVPFIRATHPGAYIIVGGGLATNMYQDLLDRFPEIDAICYGEGEIPLKKFIFGGTRDPSLLSSAWITRESIARGQRPGYDLVADLDDLPLIDYDYIDIGQYNGRSLENKDRSGAKVELTMHTSRGCPFNCVFCASHSVHGKTIRLMSLLKVFDTIKYYKDKYGMTILIIEDDNFLYDKNRAIAILTFVKEIGVHIEFATGVAANKIDDDLSRAMADARMAVVTLAIESGSDYVLKTLINKPLTTVGIENAVRCLKRQGIRVHAFVVIGIPGEQDHHRKETLELLLKLQIDWVYVFIAIPVIGSRLYSICRDKGYLVDPDYSTHVIGRGSIWAPGVIPADLEKFAYCMAAIVNLLENSNVKNGRYDIAEKYFKMVIKSYPKEALAHYMLSKVSSFRYLQYKNDRTDLAVSMNQKLLDGGL